MDPSEPHDGEARAHRVPAADADLFLDPNKRVCLACGLQQRCPYCEHKYPLGGCAD